MNSGRRNPQEDGPTLAVLRVLLEAYRRDLGQSAEPEPRPLPDPLPDPEPVPSPVPTMQLRERLSGFVESRRVPAGSWPGEVPPASG
ncbi:MAG TPA: hypothetical protein VN193_15045 [Candidatus Angelobacter sp.]|jgi:hypothetical protein|nr:hypothetical protein [Candidatus Angelobacter sp.]